MEALIENAAAAVWMYPLAADRTLGNVTQYSAPAGGLGWLLLASINAPHEQPERTLKLSSIVRPGSLPAIHQMVVLIEPNLAWKLHH